MKKIINCTVIAVDCVANDPVDIRCGGPAYLGFDFYVKKEETEEVKKFIIETLNSFEIPLAAIYNRIDTYLAEEGYIWTKERIAEEISNHADYLKSEAGRNYSRRRQ